MTNDVSYQHAQRMLPKLQRLVNRYNKGVVKIECGLTIRSMSANGSPAHYFAWRAVVRLEDGKLKAFGVAELDFVEMLLKTATGRRSLAETIISEMTEALAEGLLTKPLGYARLSTTE